MKPDSFLRGAFILTTAGLLVKVLGALYRIPFTRLVGSEGVGLYQMAYPIYATLLALSTSGLPVAISLLVAEKGALGDRQGARQTFFLSLMVLFVLGLLLSLGLFELAPYLATEVLGDVRAYYSLIAVAPAVLVISVVSAFRGYFQGWQLMWPTAFSQFVEQLVRVGTIFWAALVLLPRGVEFAAAGAAFGAFSGGFGSLLVLFGIFLWFEKTAAVNKKPRRVGPALPAGAGHLLKRLFAYAFPVSAGSLVMPLVQTIDAVMIPNRLRAAGYAAREATSLFGELSGMAGTLVYLPAVFTVSLASSLVPNVAAALARGDRKEIRRQVATALRITVIFCLPAAVGLGILATPITALLFGDPGAGPVTAWLAPAAFFSGLQQTTSGALQGLGFTWLPMVNLMIGCGVKILCNYYLTVLPGLGIKGAVLGSIFGFFTASLLNHLSLRHLIKYEGPMFSLLRPLLAATIMGAGLPGFYGLLSPAGDLVATCGAVLAGGATYFAVLLGTRELSPSEVRRIFR